MQDFVTLVRQSKICISSFFCVCVSLFFYANACRSLVFIHCYWLVCVRDFARFFPYLIVSSLLHFDRFPLSQCRQFLCLVINAVVFFRSSVENYAERLPTRTCWFHSQCDLEKKSRKAHRKNLIIWKHQVFLHTSLAWLYYCRWWRSTIFFPPDYCALQSSDQGYFSQFSVNFAVMIKTFCVTIVFGSRAIACNESSVRSKEKKCKQEAVVLVVFFHFFCSFLLLKLLPCTNIFIWTNLTDSTN